MEYLVHIHVQSGDADYLDVRVGDSVDDLIETMEKQNGQSVLGHLPREPPNRRLWLGHRLRERNGRITEPGTVRIWCKIPRFCCA